MTTKKKVFRVVTVVLAVAIICCLASAGTAQELDHFTYLPMMMTGKHLSRPTPTAPRPTATAPPLPTHASEAP